MTTEGIDVRSVGNTLILHETALIEAFNLKAAIEYQLKNSKSYDKWYMYPFVKENSLQVYFHEKCLEAKRCI